MKSIEEAKVKCLSNAKPDEHCHKQSQEALKTVVALYGKTLEDYRKRLSTRPPPSAHM